MHLDIEYFNDRKLALTPLLTNAIQMLKINRYLHQIKIIDDNN